MKKEMTVTEAPSYRSRYILGPHSGKIKPMVRIANCYLLEAGFTVGSKFEIEYTKGVIAITLKKSK